MGRRTGGVRLGCGVPLTQYAVDGSRSDPRVVFVGIGGCETGRLTNYAGVAMYERTGSTWTRRDYRNNLSLDACASFETAPGDRSLICTTGGRTRQGIRVAQLRWVDVRDDEIVDVELLRSLDNRPACQPDTLVVEYAQPEELELRTSAENRRLVTVRATVKVASPGPCAVEEPDWNTSEYEITYDLSGDTPTVVESSRTSLDALYSHLPHDPEL